jgi:hypothetical protein
MRSRSAWAAGARNYVAATLFVLGFAVGLTAAPSSARAEDRATKEARQHARNAKQYFDLGQWDEAIAEYREAYRLRSDPAFLFNIAQSYRRKGDLQPALDLYKNYLIENPSTPKRADIEKRIQTLEEEMRKRPAALATPREPSPAASEPSPKGVVAQPAPGPAFPASAPPVTSGQAAPVSVTGPAGAGRPVYLPVLTGGLHVAADIPGKVTVEGQDKGALPIDITELNPGTYRVRVELQDGTIDQRDIEVAAGRMTRIFVDRSPERASWLARQGAHLALEGGVGLLVGKKGSWTGAQGSAGAFLNLGLAPVVDLRAGLRVQFGSLGALNSVTLLEIPVSFRINLGTTYSIALGTTVGKRWTNGNSDAVLYPETGFFFGPEVSLATFRFGRKREFEVAAVQGIAFPLTSSRSDYTVAWGNSALDIFYNTFTFSWVW